MPQAREAEPQWAGQRARDYEVENYGSGLAGYVMRSSHALIERRFGPINRFDRVLEVGAGGGIHIDYVKHQYAEYIMTDGNKDMVALLAKRVETSGNQRLSVEFQDATHLKYPDATFDRLIATHVLEHLVHPHVVLSEWLRVVKPGGTISIILPCDPGIPWRLGRCLGVRSKWRKLGVDYDYVMALEHVNPINNLVSIIRHHAPTLDELWWPSKLRSSDLNLIYGAHIQK